MPLDDFLERLIAKIHQILDSRKRVDVLIQFGRVDKQTDKPLPPRWEVKEYGP